MPGRYNEPDESSLIYPLLYYTPMYMKVSQATFYASC